MDKKAEPTVTHNGTTYKVADLPEDARKQFLNLQVADSEIKRLQMQLALAQTAKSAYEQALVEELPKE